jgi:uncharacterized phage protein (TIGR02216 family)
MAAVLGVLRWPPDALWRATPRELAAALAGPAGRSASPATSDDLAHLMQAFPDASSSGGASAPTRGPRAG